MMKRLTGILLIVLMLTMCLVPAMAADYPQAGTDLMGGEFAIQSEPQKVISLAASNTEILFALGLGDKVAGVDVWSNYPPEAAALEPKVGDYSGPDIEKIISIGPDVVFASTSLQADAMAQLKDLGIQVVSTEAMSFAQIPDSIELIADIMGVDATPLLDEMLEKQRVVEFSLGDSAKPKVYFAVSYGEMGDWTCAAGTFIDDMITIAGGINVAHEGEVPWLMYSLEQLVMDDPDVILVSGDAAMVESLKATPGYSELRAVKEGKVYPVDPDASVRPAPRLMDVLLDIAKLLHPEVDFG